MAVEQFVFRIMGMFVGVLVCYFSYGLLKATRGASKGWLYFTITGLMLSAWTVFMTIFTLIDVPMGRVITSILFIPGSIVLAASFARLANDFGMSTPSWLTARNIWISNGVLLLVLFSTAFYLKRSDPLSVLVSVIILDAVIANVIAIIGTYYMYRSSKRKIWLSLMIFALFFMLGQFSCFYSGNCCSEGAIFEDNAACTGFELDYIQVFPIPCSDLPVNLSRMGYNLLSIAAILMVGNFYYLWKKLA